MTNQTFFKADHKFILPDLSDKLGLASPDFKIAEIYQGGMGTCAKIQNTNGQNFAVKIIHKSLLQDEHALHRYIDEMKTWLTLSACNGVVEAICLTKINDIPCIASEWMDYGNLRPYLNQSNSELFYQSIDRIVSTLDWVFTKYSIIHRDLKPENILLDKTGKVFIADWGLSRPISNQSEETNFQNALNKLSNRIEITDAGSFLGTIIYASPEQILGLKGIDHRSDIYSLGCIMYEWETGTPPFIGNSPQEIALQHLKNKPKTLRRLFKSTNYKVEKIIEKCLEKDPDKRFQNYSDLIDAFQSIATRYSTFNKFKIRERYKVPLVGKDEFSQEIKEKKIKGIFKKEGKYAVIEQSEIEPYLKEAQNLILLGDYEKAKNILERFYIYDLFKKNPDYYFVQHICINLALALRYLGEVDNAISVLKTLESANSKPDTFYLNLSMLYLLKNDYPKAENLCKQGLKSFPDDNEILGNLTISLLNQNKLIDAKKTATKRISISRNVNSLEEFAAVLNRLADSQKNKEFPSAINNYKKALIYLEEAKQLNPNFETAQLSVANILYKLKKYEKSSEEATKVCNMSKVKTNVESSLYYVARNLLWMSAFEVCKKFCEKWLKVYTECVSLKRILSQTLVEGYVLGNYHNGARVIERSSLEFFTNIIKDEVQRLPSDFAYLAQIHAWMGDTENLNYSNKLLLQGISLYPDYWKFDFMLASIYQEYKYYDDALEYAMKSIMKAPWRESNYFLIASIYKDIGDSANANKYEKEGTKLKQEKIKLYA